MLPDVPQLQDAVSNQQQLHQRQNNLQMTACYSDTSKSGRQQQRDLILLEDDE